MNFRSSGHPRISVVIRSRTDSSQLIDILDRLREQAPERPEIVCVDSGSSEEILSQVRPRADVVIEIPSDSFNSAGALNQGIARAHGEWIAILSHDALPSTEHYLSTLAGAFEDPNVAGAYARQIPRPDDHPLNVKDLETTYPPESRTQSDDPWLDNACSMIRKDLWRERPFDESMHITEDHDWAKWAQSRGMAIRYVAEATVRHSHPRSLERIRERFYQEGLGLARLRKGSYPAWKAAFDGLRDIASDALWLMRRGKVLWIPASILDRATKRWALYRGWKHARRRSTGNSPNPG